MINSDRIVPVTNASLLDIYAVELRGVSNIAKLAATSIGEFTADDGVYLCTEPLKSCNFTESTGTVYFVADYDYEGFSLDGTATTTAGATVNADAMTLYKAVLSTSTVTITKESI